MAKHDLSMAPQGPWTHVAQISLISPHLYNHNFLWMSVFKHWCYLTRYTISVVSERNIKTDKLRTEVKAQIFHKMTAIWSGNWVFCFSSYEIKRSLADNYQRSMWFDYSFKQLFVSHCSVAAVVGSFRFWVNVQLNFGATTCWSRTNCTTVLLLTTLLL